MISEIPVEGDESTKTVSKIEKLLKSIELAKSEKESFCKAVNELADYLDYSTRPDHLEKLYNTISDSKYFSAFEPDKYQNISITFHSSKGLEFDQVIVFAEDYRLSDMSSLYNHYVAVTRAKNKLFIIKINNYNSNLFQENLEKIFAKRGLEIANLITVC